MPRTGRRPPIRPSKVRSRPARARPPAAAPQPTLAPALPQPSLGSRRAALPERRSRALPFRQRFATSDIARLRWPVSKYRTVFSKRGFAAPLLFLALALAAKGSVDATATLWLCGLAVLWVSGALLPRAETPRVSVLGFAVFGY